MPGDIYETYTRPGMILGFSISGFILFAMLITAFVLSIINTVNG